MVINYMPHRKILQNFGMHQLVPLIEMVLDLRHWKLTDSCDVQSDFFLCSQICQPCIPSGDGLL